MARAAEITLGFVGSGAVEKKNVNALLRDYIDANGGNVKFLLPMTLDFWSEGMDVVSDFAVTHSIPVEAITDDTTMKTRTLKALVAGARKQHKSGAVAHRLAALLEEARDGRLVVLWDDEDEGAMEAVREADERGISLLELTRGMDTIELVAGEDEDDGEADEDSGEEVEEPESDEEDEEEVEEEDEEVEEEDEFEEAEAEVDLDVAAEDDDDEEEVEAEEEFPDDEDEPDLPEEDEEEAPDIEEDEEIMASGLSEFQGRLLAVLEATSAAIVRAIDAALAEGSTAAVLAEVERKVAPKPVARPVKKAATPAKAPAPKKVAPAPKKVTPAVETPAKRTVPPKKVAPKAGGNGSGTMTKAQAQTIMDEYKPKRGRPPAEVTQARAVLGL